VLVEVSAANGAGNCLLSDGGAPGGRRAPCTARAHLHGGVR